MGISTPVRVSCDASGPAGRWTRRLFKPLLSLALVAAASAAFGAAPARMKIGTTVWIGYGPFYVAEALDLYKKHNLQVSLQVFSDPALIASAIASGAIDGGTLTYDQVIGQVAAGRAQKVVLPIDYSNGGDAIVADKTITRLADFKGQKIGFNPLSPSDFLLTYALKTAGLTDKDISPVSMTPESVPAAMASGQMPIGVTYEPSLSQILGQGGGKKFKVVFSSKETPGLIADVLVFDAKTIQARPVEISAIIGAYLDGLAYMKAKPDDAAKIIGKFMGVTPKQVKEQLSGVYNIPLAEMPKAFAKSADTTSYYGSAEVIGKLLLDKGQIKAIPAIEATMDARFVTALTKK
ncbi:ABC transporter substrate-binding protein [Verminephrobacter eiseniae]|uniref:ABC transporter substrate-binding protein n=1 Tax=Verminephrobacter eiseniae TaxID=364317 RepID=UPI00223724A4|nr:ABC transporter substrate-binding protein [Verminephrobacter eiseniae]MCW5232606.1 nitrate ABC transporter substrate-binding protein [Verminephrobacter eiseniae]MCW5295829.1 nitrate ABC transporter substrate-binding protein [Verminephrobacter eiseniae]MCW8186661.1 nitrate ABC transporter substrate-binding protein [Verminephrobacter eiseniae]MCW8222840.1 nitrate ABC transporter substrate-binding protein [Verminephrobacter eiseniae]MCW8236040.1 nitrate ABC transporter substrate-binding protei